jgi:hypothetical protein
MIVPFLYFSVFHLFIWGFNKDFSHSTVSSFLSLKLVELAGSGPVQYPWSFVTPILFHRGQPSYGGDRKIFEVMTSTLPKGTLGSVASRTSLKTGIDCRYSGRVCISCSTSDNSQVTLVTDPVISHEWVNDMIVMWNYLPTFTS